MNTKNKIRFFNLILSGFLYPAMTFTVPMGSGGVVLIAGICAPIALIGSLLFSFCYYLLHKKPKLAEWFFWIAITLVLFFTLGTFPYR